MEYYEAPDYSWEHTGLPKIFLAGGITGVEDWQSQAKRILSANPTLKIAIMNPRRADFPMHDPSAAREQITWEYEALDKADAILFWFPKGALQPIALFELGRWSARTGIRKIFVGRDDGYERKQDVDIQLALARPEVKINTSLIELIEEVMHWRALSRWR